MNTGQNAPAMAKEPQRAFKSILGYQQEVAERNANQFSRLYGIVSRLDDICNRINASDFSKNLPQPCCETQDQDGSAKLADNPRQPSGFLAELVNNNTRSAAQTEELIKIIEQITESLGYIEIHI